MSLASVAEVVCFFLLLFCIAPLLGMYIAKIFTGKTFFLKTLLSPLENICYKLCGIDVNEEMSALCYAKSLFLFNLFGFTFLFLLQLFQHVFPLNPQNFPGVDVALSFNTAVSFVTNTNWQAYAGETTLSYLTQMLGLTVQNFLSAATGLSVLFALIRGIERSNSKTIGNCWKDLVQCIIYILVPLATILALFLVSEGVVQTFSPYVEASTLEGAKQTIPLGPVASQVAIKQLGSNGGGFFSANGAHPFENPSAFSNFIEVFAIVLLPASLVWTFAVIINSRRQGLLIFIVMTLFLLGGFILSVVAENVLNPILGVHPVLEGIETRFGITNSVLWSVATTAISNGSVNNALTSLSPLSGGIALLNIILGEVIFGGVGVGLCSMLMFILLTVFLSGLMCGRTPEYLGKKIEKNEIRWVMIFLLTPTALILIGSGLSMIIPKAHASVNSLGPHGFTAMIYTFATTAGNNGSSFSNIVANTTYYNIVLGIVMLIGRASILFPALAIAGLFAKKIASSKSKGTFSTKTVLFAALLSSVILIIGALSFFPALSLGPILEHFLMLEGRAF